MPRHFRLLVLLFALPSLVACASLAHAESFEVASIQLEQNVTDGDGEAVIKVKTEESGLRWLLLVAPDGRRLARYDARNPQNLGARELLIETPEPGLGQVLVAYPEGTYRLIGLDFEGEDFFCELTVSHDFAEAATFTTPEEDEVVPATGLTITWQPGAGAVAYFLELEDEARGRVLTVDLPGDATTFSPPPGWLLAATEYVIGLGSIAENGNRTFVETVFSTEE